MNNEKKVFTQDEHGRVCTKCGEHKTWDQYHKQKDGFMGYRSICKVCIKQRDAERHAVQQKVKDEQKRKLFETEEAELDKKYPDRISYEKAKELGLKKYFTGRPCKNGHIDRRYVSTKNCLTCDQISRKKSYSAEYQANWYQRNKEKVLEQQKEYLNNNREKRNEYQQKWNKANPEKRKAIERRHEERRREKRNAERAELRKTDLGFLLKERYRDRILKAVKNNRSEKAYKTAELLGCTVPEFIEYLKGTMTEGMSWEIFMESDDIHLDHIRPISSFDMNNPKDQKVCFRYDNYQLLWKEENLSKGAKYKGVDYRTTPN